MKNNLAKSELPNIDTIENGIYIIETIFYPNSITKIFIKEITETSILYDNLDNKDVINIRIQLDKFFDEYRIVEKIESDDEILSIEDSFKKAFNIVPDKINKDIPASLSEDASSKLFKDFSNKVFDDLIHGPFREGNTLKEENVIQKVNEELGDVSLTGEANIRTWSGQLINLANPKPENILIHDIAIALSRIPRWAGHTNIKITVGQHSIMCVELAKKYFGNSINPKELLEILLHDASEAYMLDIPTPLKNILPEYKKLENQLMTVIANKYGIQFPFVKSTKIIDNYQMKIEWQNLIEKKNNDFSYVMLLSEEETKEKFLNLFNSLNEEIIKLD